MDELKVPSPGTDSFLLWLTSFACCTQIKLEKSQTAAAKLRKYVKTKTEELAAIKELNENERDMREEVVARLCFSVQLAEVLLSWLTTALGTREHGGIATKVGRDAGLCAICGVVCFNVVPRGASLASTGHDDAR